MTGAKRPQGDWYTPYFAPTTVLIAVTVLIVSVQAGKFVGNYYVQRERAASPTMTLPNAVLPAGQLPARATTPGTAASAHITHGKHS